MFHVDTKLLMYIPNCVGVISIKRNAKRDFAFVPIYITKYLVNVRQHHDMALRGARVTPNSKASIVH